MIEVLKNLDWSAIVALLALVLTQVRPVRSWFVRPSLDVHVHSRVNVTHKFGNPNLSMYLMLRNAGASDIKITDASVAIFRAKTSLSVLPAQNYYASLKDNDRLLFVPFVLKPKESWEHGTNFVRDLDRNTDKVIREAVSRQRVEIERLVEERKASGGQGVVRTSEQFVQPFLELYKLLFIWESGEYEIKLTINAEPKSASISRTFRLTIFESESDELKKHVDDYPTGFGVYLDIESHSGLWLPVQQDVDNTAAYPVNR